MSTANAKAPVKPSASGPDNGGDDSQSLEGKRASGSTGDDNVDWKNKAKEYERKLGEATTKLDAVLERVDELEEKEKLSAKERAELNRLKERKVDLEDLVDALEDDPKAAPWVGLAKRQASKVAKEAAAEAVRDDQIKRMNRFLKKTAVKHNMKPEDLRKHIIPFVGKHMDEDDPSVRAEEAYADWLEDVKVRTKLAKVEEDEKAAAEAGKTGGGGQQRKSAEAPKSVDEAKSLEQKENLLNNLLP